MLCAPGGVLFGVRTGFLIDVNPDFLYYIFFPAKVKNHYKELCLHEKEKKYFMLWKKGTAVL